MSRRGQDKYCAGLLIWWALSIIIRPKRSLSSKTKEPSPCLPQPEAQDKFGCAGVANQDADELPPAAPAASAAGASTPGDPNDDNNDGKKGKKDPKVEYNGEQRSVYRGGSDLTVKSGEVKINPSTGKVTPARGISVNVDPGAVAKFGGAFKIAWLPAGLEIVQRGLSATHYEIVPAFEMALSEFQALLDQIVLLPY